MKSSRVLLAAGAGVAAVTFHGFFTTGCGGANGCIGPNGQDYCAPEDSGSDVKDARADSASDAATDAASDASSDATSDAAEGDASDASADVATE